MVSYEVYFCINEINGRESLDKVEFKFNVNMLYAWGRLRICLLNLNKFNVWVGILR